MRRLAKRDLVRVVAAIEALADEPRPRGSRKLAGFDDVYRIRVEAYRVIYGVEKYVVTITILKLGHRRDVYR